MSIQIGDTLPAGELFYMGESGPTTVATGEGLVMPVGPTAETQELVRVVRRDAERYDEERLTGVRFVPLVPGTR